MNKYILEVDIDGTSCTGYRIVKSNRKGKYQIIHLTEKIFERDQGYYDKFSDQIMEFCAKNILIDLINKNRIKIY